MPFYPARSWFAAALVVMVSWTFSPALRAQHRIAAMPDSAEWSSIVRLLRKTVEPHVCRKTQGASLRVEKDSILLTLAMLDAAALRYPHSPQLAWIRGLYLIKQGSLFDGIAVLDGLRRTGFDNEEFLSDYARSLFYAVVPPKADTFSLLIGDGAFMRRADTVSPQAFTWKIITSQKAALPFFDYEAAFTFRKQFRLEFGYLPGHGSTAALLQYHRTESQSSASINLQNQLSERIDSARCAIHIDVNDITISPFEYLLRRINKMYDSIAVQSDLTRFNAISLRCYSMGFWGREGTRTAYIVFDRTLDEIMRSATPPRRVRGKNAGRKIRFTITMRSSIETAWQAEEKLQSILDAF